MARNQSPLLRKSSILSWTLSRSHPPEGKSTERDGKKLHRGRIDMPQSVEHYGERYH